MSDFDCYPPDDKGFQRFNLVMALLMAMFLGYVMYEIVHHAEVVTEQTELPDNTLKYKEP